MSPDHPPGLDLDRLRALLDHERPGLVNGPLTGRLIEGGRSNLTYAVSDGTARWVVRRPPLGHVLATAHDMKREHRVISALHPTAVPVPNPVLLCEDDSVLGAPFYVMEFVEGTPSARPTSSPRSARSAPVTRCSAWSTHWSNCTRWIPPRSVSPTSAAPRASWTGNCAAGESSWTRPGTASWPASTSCTPPWDANCPLPRADRRPRRLPARQRADRARRPDQGDPGLGDVHAR